MVAERKKYSPTWPSMRIVGCAQCDSFGESLAHAIAQSPSSNGSNSIRRSSHPSIRTSEKRPFPPIPTSLSLSFGEGFSFLLPGNSIVPSLSFYYLTRGPFHLTYFHRPWGRKIFFSLALPCPAMPDPISIFSSPQVGWKIANLEKQTKKQKESCQRNFAKKWRRKIRTQTVWRFSHLQSVGPS